MKDLLLTAGRRLEAAFDAARFRLKLRLGRLDEIEVFPYRGHGTRNALFLKGRVLERKGITPSTQTDTVRTNLANMARRFFSSEVPGAVVRARFGDCELETTADEEGFFEVRMEPGRAPRRVPESDDEWHEVEIELVRPPSPGGREVRSVGRVLIPEDAEFGVISDIDDTVVQSWATDVLKMAWISLLNNAHTRLPFPGVGRFYEALRRGSGGASRNPLFYVSSSPWNLYDLLADFMEVHGVPPGPIFLKDWSPTVLKEHDEHKRGVINGLLAAYPELPFILVGDSGERDPEIYARTISENPGRVRAVFIRDVTDEARDMEVAEICRDLASQGVPTYLVKDSAHAAEHALSLGLIPSEAVREVYAAIP